MIHVSICITLLTLIAALHLFIKVKKEDLGMFLKLFTYLILLTGVLLLICQIARGVSHMRCAKEGDCKKECPDEMMVNPRMMHHRMMMHERCGMHGGEEGIGQEEECNEMKMKCEGDSNHCKMKCSDKMGQKKEIEIEIKKEK